jgi:hypothetical protein
MTFAFSTNFVLMGQLMWIEHLDFSGGPFSYYLSQGSSWMEVLGSSTDIVGNFMSAGEPPDVTDYCSNLDVFCVRQIYRCYIAWNSVWAALPLVLIFLASTGEGIDVLFGKCFAIVALSIVECTPEIDFQLTKSSCSFQPVVRERSPLHSLGLARTGMCEISTSLNGPTVLGNFLLLGTCHSKNSHRLESLTGWG